MGNGEFVLFVETLAPVHLCQIASGFAILDASADVEIGVDAVTGVVGLFDFLISTTISTPTSLRVRRTSVMMRVHLIVAS